MGELVKVRDAARMLGVSRQTVMNWGKHGVVRLIAMDGDKARYLDSDVIGAISPKAGEIERLNDRMDEMRDEVERLTEELDRRKTEIKAQIGFVNRTGRFLVSAEFYRRIPTMMCELGVLSEREAAVMASVIDHNDYDEVAEEFGCTRERIRQVFCKAIRMSSALYGLKDKIDDYDRLAAENEEMRHLVRSMAERLSLYERDEKVVGSVPDCVLGRKVVDLELSVRARNCLVAAGVRTVADIVKVKRNDLMMYRNMGHKTMAEIETFLAGYGLKFDMDVDGIMIEKYAR